MREEERVEVGRRQDVEGKEEVRRRQMRAEKDEQRGAVRREGEKRAEERGK